MEYIIKVICGSLFLTAVVGITSASDISHIKGMIDQQYEKTSQNLTERRINPVNFTTSVYTNKTEGKNETVAQETAQKNFNSTGKFSSKYTNIPMNVTENEIEEYEEEEDDDEEYEEEAENVEVISPNKTDQVRQVSTHQVQKHREPIHPVPKNQEPTDQVPKPQEPTRVSNKRPLPNYIITSSSKINQPEKAYLEYDLKNEPSRFYWKDEEDEPKQLSINLLPTEPAILSEVELTTNQPYEEPQPVSFSSIVYNPDGESTSELSGSYYDNVPKKSQVAQSRMDEAEAEEEEEERESENSVENTKSVPYTTPEPANHFSIQTPLNQIKFIDSYGFTDPFDNRNKNNFPYQYERPGSNLKNVKKPQREELEEEEEEENEVQPHRDSRPHKNQIEEQRIRPKPTEADDLRTIYKKPSEAEETTPRNKKPIEFDGSKKTYKQKLPPETPESTKHIERPKPIIKPRPYYPGRGYFNTTVKVPNGNSNRYTYKEEQNLKNRRPQKFTSDGEDDEPIRELVDDEERPRYQTERQKYPGTTERPRYQEQTERTRYYEQTERPRYQEPTSKTRYYEQTERPRYQEQTERTRYYEQTERPRYQGSTDRPRYQEQTERPRYQESTERPRYQEQTERTHHQEITERPRYQEPSDRPRYEEQTTEHQRNEENQEPTEKFKFIPDFFKTETKPVVNFESLDETDRIYNEVLANIESLFGQRTQALKPLTSDEAFGPPRSNEETFGPRSSEETFIPKPIIPVDYQSHLLPKFEENSYENLQNDDESEERIEDSEDVEEDDGENQEVEEENEEIVENDDVDDDAEENSNVPIRVENDDEKLVKDDGDNQREEEEIRRYPEVTTASYSVGFEPGKPVNNKIRVIRPERPKKIIIKDVRQSPINQNVIRVIVPNIVTKDSIAVPAHRIIIRKKTS